MTVSRLAADREVLRDVVRVATPVDTVYLGTAPAVAEEYQLEWAARWRPLAERLRGAGAAEASVAALEEAVAGRAAARATHAMGEVAAFAAEGRMLATVPAAEARWHDWAGVGRPAHVFPLLEWMQEHPAHVLAVVDHAGGEVVAFPGGGAAGRATTVEGPDDDIERTAPTGIYAQDRHQHRIEDSWRHNAGAVARQVVTALDGVGAGILVLAGDVRALQLLRHALPERVRREVLVTQISGGRAADGSQRRRTEQVAQAVRTASERILDDLVRVFTEQRAPGGLAVEGEDATLSALAAGRVATLLLARPLVDDPREAWFGRGATEVLPGTRPTPDWPDPVRGRLLDVAVRSTLLTGGEVRLLPPSGGTPAEGLGALCRFH